MKRYTRKELYAMHGIEFDGDRHIKAPWGEWIPLLLKDGNSKVGKHVATWTLLPGTNGTCPCDCENCYAKEGRYNTPCVIACMTRNTYIVEHYTEWFIAAIIAQVHVNHYTQVRIHAAGDFQTTNKWQYVSAWKTIASATRNTSYWTYTKCKDVENAFDDISNLHCVKSIIDGYGVNFGTCEYIISAYEYLKERGENVWICKCATDKQQHCENCAHCMKSKFVLFLDHSKNYNAKADSLYPVVCELIDGQVEA